jgi:hypothetical protein
MHGSFVAGAYCFTNTVGCQYASAITLSVKECFLVFKWSEVFELVVGHVISHSNGQVSKVVLCDTVKLCEIGWRQVVLITH